MTGSLPKDHPLFNKGDPYTLMAKHDVAIRDLVGKPEKPPQYEVYKPPKWEPPR